MMNKVLASLALTLALLPLTPASAQSDPSLHEVYEALRTGQVDHARDMMKQVLRDHPNSAKAHYVAAEVDARGGDLGAARQELATAERLAPGLPFARPASVAELRRELGERPPAMPFQSPASAPTGIPWTAVIAVIGVVAVIVLLLRRRTAAPPGEAAPFGGTAAATLPPAPVAPAAPAAPGILGNVASGLAMGAAVVAGEELMRHVLEPGHREFQREPLPESPARDPNADLGGSDFGVSDAGSWDDAGGAGGGDDWG